MVATIILSACGGPPDIEDRFSVDGEEISSILDNTTSYQMFQFYFLYMIKNLIETANRSDLPKTNDETTNYPEDDGLITTSVQLEEEYMGEITEIDIVRGDLKKRKEKIANVIVAMLNMLRKEKSLINLNSQMVKEKLVFTSLKNWHVC